MQFSNQDAYADLQLYCPHMSEDPFSHDTSHMVFASSHIMYYICYEPNHLFIQILPITAALEEYSEQFWGCLLLVTILTLFKILSAYYSPVEITTYTSTCTSK